MIRLLSTLILVAISLSSTAEELTAEKKLVIDEMLKVTGALELSELMAAATADQIISVMAEQQGNVDPNVIAIIRDETKKNYAR